jgi:hypothetical protein
MSHHAPQLATGSAIALQRVGSDPAQLFTVESYWTAFDEPIELLTDAAATFALDAARLAVICNRHRIAYRADDREPAFPVWLLREVYPANP